MLWIKERRLSKPLGDSEIDSKGAWSQEGRNALDQGSLCNLWAEQGGLAAGKLAYVVHETITPDQKVTKNVCRRDLVQMLAGGVMKLRPTM